MARPMCKDAISGLTRLRARVIRPQAQVQGSLVARMLLVSDFVILKAA